jgi:hypothetical protein
VQYDYPISAIYRDTPREPLGVIGLPGTYTVRLTVGGRTFSRPLTLRMDPRASITLLGLTRQFTLAGRIANMMNRTFTALQSAREADPQPPVSSFQSAAASRQSPAAGRQSALEALNNDLATAYDVVEGADRAPTAQAAQAVTALERRLATLEK